MIYELSLVTVSALAEEELATIKNLVQNVVKEKGGEVLIEDDWGQITFAQPTKNGVPTGHFLYYLYTGNGECNLELNRLFGINEKVLKRMTIAKGDESQREAIVKAYKSPYSKTYHGSQVEDKDSDSGSGSKRFTRGRSCWFAANNIRADWKDPNTFQWLINDFGKISPARVTGVSTKHQRFVTEAIKRARQIGLASYVNSRISATR